MNEVQISFLNTVRPIKMWNRKTTGRLKYYF